MPIDPSGLYWVVGLPNGLSASAATVSSDNAQASLQLSNLSVIDEPAFPKAGPTYPATQDIDVRWTATGATQTLTDPAKHFAITGRPASVTARFAVSEPSRGFTFHGEATSLTYAFVGDEVNGYFYDRGTTSPGTVAPAGVNAGTGGQAAAAGPPADALAALGAAGVGLAAYGVHRLRTLGG